MPALFITARFRTGSTLLWNMFRQVPDVVAYYEPLHEKLPSMISHRLAPQPTHFNVDSYFDAYPRLEEVSRYHRPEFGVSRLHLEAKDRYPALEEYLAFLLSGTEGGKTAVLQCNRLDFRLPWLRETFPDVPILHLHRSPRDQWLSSIAEYDGDVDTDKDADPYFISAWSRDLIPQFPFLASDFIRHPYQRHYLLWKLSYLMGSRAADLSISYEQLLASPEATMRSLLEIAGLDACNLQRCLSVLVPRATGVWESYRDDDWFCGLEQECEARLDEMGLNANFGLLPLKQIQTGSHAYQEMLADDGPRAWASRNAESAIVALRTQLDDKEEVIQNYHQTVLDKERSLQEGHQLMLAKEHTLQESGHALVAMETGLREKDTILHEKETILIAQASELAVQEGVINSLLRLRRSSLQYWLINRPGGAVRRLYRPRSVAGAVRSSGRRLSRLGSFQHYRPATVVIPSRYVRSRPLLSPPTVCIVTPNFNYARYLELTIRSVLDQNYPALEYVLQDGASTDGSQLILRKFASQVAYIDSAPDNGQSDAINRGFKHTTGEIMAYLNSDDLLLPGAINYVARYFNEHSDVDVVYGHRIVIDDAGMEIGRWVMPRHDDTILSWADYIPQETMFWRRSIWEKVGGYVDESFFLCMDWDLILRFRSAGARFRRLPRFLGAFRYHGDSHTANVLEGIGKEEMSRLRQRSCGHPVSAQEVRSRMQSYHLRHVLYDRAYRLHLLRH